MSTPPTYYFNNINFNSNFFVPATSGANLGSLMPYFLHKVNGDKATGTKTISSGSNMKNTLNIAKTAFNYPQMNFKTTGGTLQGFFKTDLVASYLDTQSLANGLRILSSNTVLYSFSSTAIQIPGYLGYSYSSLPAYTVDQIGFNYGTNTQSYTGNKSAVGPYTAYSSANSVPLPIGVYRIMVTATVAGVANANATVSSVVVGYNLGTNATPSLNSANPIYSSQTVLYFHQRI